METRSRIVGRVVIVVVTMLVVLTPAVAARGADLPRRHDGGFFLRLAAGGGSASTEIEYQGNRTEYSGGCVDLEVAIGAVVAENLAVHGTLFGWGISDTEVEVSGLGSAQTNADVTFGAIGGGLTYFLMPVNAYVSASLGVGSLTLDTGNESFDTDDGLALEVCAGKEWWVGDRWGLGVAFGVTYHSVPDGGVDADWTGPSYTLRFSATLN